MNTCNNNTYNTHTLLQLSNDSEQQQQQPQQQQQQQYEQQQHEQQQQQQQQQQEHTHTQHTMVGIAFYKKPLWTEEEKGTKGPKL